MSGMPSVAVAPPRQWTAARWATAEMVSIGIPRATKSTAGRRRLGPDRAHDGDGIDEVGGCSLRRSGRGEPDAQFRRMDDHAAHDASVQQFLPRRFHGGQREACRLRHELRCRLRALPRSR